METPQEVQEHYAACAVVNTFASNARPCQLAQLGDDYHRITHTHAERFYLGRAVTPEVNIQIDTTDLEQQWIVGDVPLIFGQGSFDCLMKDVPLPIQT